MAYSQQGGAITGRRQYVPAGTGARPPYYPKQPGEAIPPPRQYPYSKGYNAGVGAPDLNSGYYGGINKDDMMAAQEEGYYENIEREKRGETPLTEIEIHQAYLNKYKIPNDELTRLQTDASYRLPGGDMDISQGMAEGQTNVDAMPGGRGFQDAGHHAQKGEYGKAISDTVQGMLAMTMAPMTAPLSIAKPAIDYAKSKIKGLFSPDVPTVVRS